jgi:hypothetical protein
VLLIGQEWNHLPRSHPPRLPRGRDAVLLLPIRRDYSSPSLAQQDRTLLSPPLLRLSPSHSHTPSPTDRCLQALRLHRVRLRLGRSNRPRDDGQLPPLGPHPRLQGRPRRSDSPQDVDRRQPQVPPSAQGSRRCRQEECCELAESPSLVLLVQRSALTPFYLLFNNSPRPTSKRPPSRSAY